MRFLDSIKSNSSSKIKSVIAEVTQARAFTSYLKLLKTTAVCDLTRASHPKFPIRLASSLPYEDEWLATKKRSFDVHIDIEEHSFSFHVLLNNYKEYEILDESDHKIINLPTISHD